MTAIVLFLIVLIALFVLLGFSRAKGVVNAKTEWHLRPRQFLSLLSVVILLFAMCVTVPTGHTGILTTFGHVEERTLEAGFHLILPVQEVISMDNRAQKAVLDLSCFSSDIQEVMISYSLNYQINKENAQNIYRTIGPDYYNIIILPRIQEAVKAVTAQYTADNLVAKRSELSEKITDTLTEELDDYNIIVLNAAIENMDFSDVFTDAVEAKQVAEQQKLKAAIEQEQMNIEAKQSAERKKIEAEAQAEVARIAADAELYEKQQQAEANKALAESISENLIRYNYVNGWDGKLPQIMGSDTVMPVLEGFGTEEVAKAAD